MSSKSSRGELGFKTNLMSDIKSEDDEKQSSSDRFSLDQNSLLVRGNDVVPSELCRSEGGGGDLGSSSSISTRLEDGKSSGGRGEIWSRKSRRKVSSRG